MQIVGDIVLGIGIFLIGISIGVLATFYFVEIKGFDEESTDDSN